MILAHKIELDTTYQQRAYFAQCCGTARFVWNQALAAWDRQYAAGGKPSGSSLKKEFNQDKYALFPWMKEVACGSSDKPPRSNPRRTGRVEAGTKPRLLVGTN